MAIIEIDNQLYDQLKQAYPEIQKMTYTKIADWAPRKLLEIKKEA